MSPRKVDLKTQLEQILAQKQKECAFKIPVDANGEKFNSLDYSVGMLLNSKDLARDFQDLKAEKAALQSIVDETILNDKH